MIVCSIMVDFGKVGAHLDQVFEGFQSTGAFLADGSAIYFATDDFKIKEAWVRHLLERNGYDQSIIRVFSKDALPQQSGSPVIYGWLIDHIVSNAKKEFEAVHQEQLKKAAAELDKINGDLGKIKETVATSEALKAKEGAKDNGGKQDGGDKE